MKRLLIKNADWILTMDAGRRRLKHSDILVEDNVIAKIGSGFESEGPFDEVIDAKGMIALPGFVNTHHHCYQSLVRNITVANGLTLEPWLAVVYEIFQELSPESVDAGIMVSLGELLKTGCTTSMDHHYPFPVKTSRELIDAEIKAASRLGIRFHPTRGSMSKGKSKGTHVPEALVQNAEEILEDSERLIKTYHDPKKYSMLRIGLAPCWHGFDSLPEVMEKSLEMARRYGVHCHSHLAESKAEIGNSIQKFGCRPVEYVRRLGWIGKDIYFAHCVQLNDEEVELMASTGTGIAHCPVSNMFLNSGVCRVPELIKKGGRVGLGVDGSASSNSSNMMAEIKTCYLMHQLQYGHDGLTAEQVLELATFRGAEVLGRNDIGRLEPGMAADITLMNWNQLQYAGGCNDPAACIVMSGDSRMVDTVIVNGNVVVQSGALLTVNEAEETAKANETGKEMLRRASERVPGLKQDL